MVKLANKHVIYGIATLIILLLIDQIAKLIIIKNNINIILIQNVLELNYVQNTGGAFGVGQGNTSMFIISNIIVIVLIARFIYSQKHMMDKVTLYSLFVIIAGGIRKLNR